MATTLTLVLDDDGPRITPALVERLHAALAADAAAAVVMLVGGPAAFCEGLDLERLQAGTGTGATRDIVAPPAPVEATVDAFDPVAAMDPSGSTAEPRHAGLDPTRDFAERCLTAFAAWLVALRCTPRPVVAVVDGAALGGGVGIAAAADIVLASRRATFALPETLFGLVPGVVFPYVAARVGAPRALGLALTGRTLDAREALAWGLVDEVCDDVQAVARRTVRRLLRHDRRAHAAIKALALRAVPPAADYTAAATSAFAALLDTPQTRARLARFMAGDTPWPDDAELSA